jgi:hypothetical protein
VVVEYAKRQRIFKEHLGAHVHPSEVVDWNSSPGDLKRAENMAKSSANYNASLSSVMVFGFNNLANTIDIVDRNGDVISTFSGKECLMLFFKMQDGSPLIAEVHQAVGGGETHLVFPNTPEAEALVNGFVKHAGGFSLNYLKDIGVDERVVVDFVTEFIDPALAHSAEQCVWDSASKTIKTADEHADEAGMVELEKNSWFIDIMSKTQEKEDTKRGKYASAANLFDLDAQSTKTMHAKNDIVELDGDGEGDDSLASTLKAKRKETEKTVEQRTATGKQPAYESVSSSEEEEEGLFGAETEDRSREASVGHTDAADLREGNTPTSVGVRFTRKQHVAEQVTPESTEEDDIEMSSTASVAGHVEEVAGNDG